MKVQFQQGESNIIKANIEVGKTNRNHTFHVQEDVAFRVIDKKEFTIKLKKKGFLFFGNTLIEEKKIKLSELATQCEVTKDITFTKAK